MAKQKHAKSHLQVRKIFSVFIQFIFIKKIKQSIETGTTLDG